MWWAQAAATQAHAETLTAKDARSLAVVVCEVRRTERTVIRNVAVAVRVSPVQPLETSMWMLEPLPAP